MSRNGSGTYVVVNSFIAGTTITASDHNENWTDVAAEISNSLALDGQSVMTGQFKAASGSAALPGMAFSADLDCGWYRIGANNFGGAVNGAKVLDVGATGLGITGALTVSGATTATGFVGPGIVPLGGLIPYIGSTAPDNFLFPYGQAISRTTYADLFALIGTGFGAGDGSTTFNIIDLRGRAIFGVDNMGGSAASRITVAGGNFDGTLRGGTGGAQNQTLTQAQLPAVSPTFTGSSVNVNGGEVWGGNSVAIAGGAAGTVPNANNFGTGTVTAAGTISALGSGNAHPIMPPAMTLPYILRVT